MITRKAPLAAVAHLACRFALHPVSSNDFQVVDYSKYLKLRYGYVSYKKMSKCCRNLLSAIPNALQEISTTTMNGEKHG